MLNLARNNLPLLSAEIFKKQRTLLLIIAFSLLVGGILCLVNPFASGATLSIAIGILLILSGIALIIGNRQSVAKHLADDRRHYIRPGLPDYQLRVHYQPDGRHSGAGGLPSCAICARWYCALGGGLHGPWAAQ